MPRTVSSAARTAMYSQETDEMFVLLLQISNEDDPTDPIRVCLDNIGNDITTKLTVGGVDTYPASVEFAAGFFGVELPEESGENIGTVRIQVGNVDRAIVEAIRRATMPPEVQIWIVLKSSPDEVEAGPFFMILDSATYDASVVTGELAFDDVTNRRYPAHEYTPHYTPALF